MREKKVDLGEKEVEQLREGAILFKERGAVA